MGLTHGDAPTLHAWMLDAAHAPDGGVTFTRELAEAFRARGAPLWRCSLSLMTMHPEVFWRNVQWTEEGGVKVLPRTYETLASPFFTASPIAAIRQGAPSIRVRLTAGRLAYPICEDLRDQGGTDYYSQGLRFTTGETSYVSWATRATGGFDAETIEVLDALLPSLARRVELESAYHATRALLEVYLGHNAARRVLAGAFRRGAGERIEAVVWSCDLRGFTEMSDGLPAEDVVGILDAYFDCVAGAIGEQGGEVLKFIGDAVLAIFPVADGRVEACARAVRAATLALDALSALKTALPGPLAIGIALHVGSVMYGNIGARGRLDFTVISSSVNEACRLEGLCKELGTPLTLSQAFVDAWSAGDGAVVDLGERTLKGVRAPLRVFTLPRYAPRR